MIDYLFALLVLGLGLYLAARIWRGFMCEMNEFEDDVERRLSKE